MNSGGTLTIRRRPAGPRNTGLARAGRACAAGLALTAALALPPTRATASPGKAGQARAAAQSGKVTIRIRTIKVGRGPDAVAVDTVTGRAYVVNRLDQTVSVVGLGKRKVLATIPVKITSFFPSIAVNDKADRIYVGGTDGRTITVINGATSKVIAAIPVGFAGLPALAIDPKAGRVYAAGGNSRAASGELLRVISTRTSKVVASVPLPVQANALTVDPATHRLYIAGYGYACTSSDCRGIVLPMNGRNHKLGTPILLGTTLGPNSIADDSASRQLFVTVVGPGAKDGGLFAVSTRTDKVIYTRAISPQAPECTAASPRLRLLGIALHTPHSGGELQIFDPGDGQALATGHLGKIPAFRVSDCLTARNGTFYVTSEDANTLSVVTFEATSGD